MKEAPLSKDPVKSAKKIIKAMKAHFKRTDLQSGDECYALEISTVQIYNKKLAGYDTFYEIHGEGYCEKVTCFSEINAIGRALMDLVPKEKGIVILDNLKYTHWTTGWYSREVTDFILPNSFRKFGKVSKEWMALCKKVKKMSGVDLEPWQTVVYSGSGKRGHIYSWDSSWFIPWDCPKWCAEMTEWLKKNKKGRDILKVEQFSTVKVDDEQYSIEHEVECSGSKLQSYRFTVVTPKGKVKGTRTLSQYGG